jgi:glucose/arabinose dehydrogenase
MASTRPRFSAGILTVAVMAAACSSGDGPFVAPTGSPTIIPTTPRSPTPAGTPTTTPTAVPDLRDVNVRLVSVVTLESAVAMAIRAGDDALYVAEVEGRVVALRGGRPEEILDISGDVSAGGERGLLGIAFSPDGEFLYVNYTDLNGDTRVEEFPFRNGRADRGGRRAVLSVDQPFSNHNGGNLFFGPDGFLYIGLGDGGSQGDPHGNGQNLGALLAKMLRIDPRRQGDAPYGIPEDNPFVGRRGARGEVWAYGLRNPWRYSFDRETGDLWIADVGGNEREEVDLEPAGSDGGRNYGWNLMEGTVRHTENLPDGLVRPVFEYTTHEGGTCAITGGYVYRGSAIPGLVGAYLYSDFCVGEIRALRLEGRTVRREASLGIGADSLASFGEDQNGELYVLSLAGEVFRIEPA